MRIQNHSPYGQQGEFTGSLRSSKDEMMATLAASGLASGLVSDLTLGLMSDLTQSLHHDDLARYARLCQAAENVGLVPHAQPKAHMVRDFTQWFHGWLVQNEELMYRQEKAQALYNALTAQPIIMGPAAGNVGGDGVGEVNGDVRDEARHALVPVPSYMPVCCGDD
ncbi:MAG: hypothetical protein R3Y11_03435 [Pseudomonadota bacterium]